MTNDYTYVQLKRQEELTRAIQARLDETAQKLNNDSKGETTFAAPASDAVTSAA